MRPEFAIAIDPIFEHVLKLLSAIEAGESSNPILDRSHILNLIDLADQRLGTSKQWSLARYAMVSWIDEMLLSSPWDGAAWWRNHILEVELFQTRDCNTRFFELAREAAALPVRDALEVFYNCVLLGFRGMYADGELSRGGVLNADIPATIELWQERVLPMIDVVPLERLSQRPEREIEGAPPNDLRFRVVWWSVAAVLLLALNGAAYHWLHHGR